MPQLDAGDRPMNVVIAGAGKSLFGIIPGVRLYKLENPKNAPIDLAVFPCSQAVNVEAWAQGLPAPLLARIAAGDVGLAFDASGEGRLHSEERTRDLHGFVRQLGVSPARCVYVTQDRSYEADYAAYCEAAGEAERMTVLTYDYWVRRFVLAYETGGEAVFADRLATYRARPRRRERRFLSLNLTPRASKALFLLSLLRDGLWDAGFISFGGFGVAVENKRRDSAPSPPPDFARIAAKLREQLSGFDDMIDDLEPLLPTLEGKGRILLGEVNADAETGRLVEMPTGDTPLPEHELSWFTVLTETEMQDRPSRITEKPLKPLVNFHPLIMFASPGSLAIIRDLGFRTFCEAIDEAYDEEFDPRRRFDMAYDEFRRLCALDEAKVDALEQSLSEALIHNARWGLTRLPAVYRDQIDPAFVARVKAAISKDEGVD